MCMEFLKPLAFLFPWAMCSEKEDIAQKHEA